MKKIVHLLRYLIGDEKDFWFQHSVQVQLAPRKFLRGYLIKEGKKSHWWVQGVEWNVEDYFKSTYQSSSQRPGRYGRCFQSSISRNKCLCVVVEWLYKSSMKEKANFQVEHKMEVQVGPKRRGELILHIRKHVQ